MDKPISLKWYRFKHYIKNFFKTEKELAKKYFDKMSGDNNNE